MEVKDIPESERKRFEQQFWSFPQIHSLVVKKQLLQQQGRFTEALELAKNIEKVHDESLAQLIREAEDDVEAISIATMKMSKEERYNTDVQFIMCFILTDILDTVLKDTNDMIKKIDKTVSFEMFDDMKELAKAVKAKLDMFYSESDYSKDVIWMDEVDNLHQMIKNKAKAILRKRTDPNWGKSYTKIKNS